MKLYVAQIKLGYQVDAQSEMLSKREKPNCKHTFEQTALRTLAWPIFHWSNNATQIFHLYHPGKNYAPNLKMF